MDTEKKFELWHFLHLAFTDYCKFVKTKKKTYDRFRKDFINGHKKPVFGEDENEHELHICSLDELLTHRRQLVEHYFMRESLSDEDLAELADAHNSTDAGQHPIEMRPAVMQPTTAEQEELQNQEFTFCMSDDQLSEVAKWMSGTNTKDKWHIRMCKDEMTANLVSLFFCGEYEIRAARGMNQKILLMLDALQEKGLITKGWADFFEKKRNLLSSKDERPLNVNCIRRSLSEARKNNDLLWKKFLDKAAEIGKMSQ